MLCGPPEVPQGLPIGGGLGFRRKPGASGRSNETRMPPVYRDGPPQSLYALDVDVESTRRTGAGRSAGRTTKNASASSSPFVSRTA
jgi:hypothetical protein